MRACLLTLSLIPALLSTGCPPAAPAAICSFDLPSAGRISSGAGFNLLVFVKGDFTSAELPAVHFVSDVEAAGSTYPDGILLESGINTDDGCTADPGCPAGGRLETPITPGTHTITAMALTPQAVVACQAEVVVRANAAPGIDSIAITPAAPTTLSNLSFSFEATDAEGDPASVAAQWIGPDGQNVAGETLSQLNTAAGETWTLRLTPRDALDVGLASTTEVVIGNTPPEAPTVVIWPVPGRENADISCAVTDLSSLDPDDAQTLTVQWSWTVDGADAGIASDTVAASAQAADEEWICAATVSDGEATSAAGTAATTVFEPATTPASLNLSGQPTIAGSGLQRLGTRNQLASPGDLDGDGFSDVILLDNNNVFVNGMGQGQGLGQARLLTGPNLTGVGPFTTTQAVTSFAGDVGLRLTTAFGPGDLNGDGIDDLVIGFRHISLPTSATGTGVYVVFGREGGWGVSVDLTEGVTYFGGGEEIGQVPCPVGDLDGDGLAELAIASPVAGDALAGRVYVAYGHGGAWPTDLNPDDLAPGFTLQGAASAQQLGAACAGRVDLDGDGYDDLAVGAPGAGSSGNGRVLVYRGEPTRWSGTLTSATADVIIDATAAGAGGFGISLSAIGDHDGDGMGDLAIYAAGPDAGSGTEGAVWIASGGAAGFAGAITTANLPHTITGVGELGFCQTSVGLDLDGDGLGDLACADLNAADAVNHGGSIAARVFLGSASLGAIRSWADAELELVAAGSAERPGAGMAASRDMDGDDLPELLVGSPDRGLVLAGNGQPTSAPGAVTIIDLD